MNDVVLAWSFFAAYAVVIITVAWYNSRKAKSLQSFSIGARDAGPVFVGLSLAANMTSAATFVINPGLVYAFGWAGFVGYSIATPLGIFLGLAVISKRFRRIGDKYSVITVPQWIGNRFSDKRLTVYLSLVSLFQITFLVLIVVGLAVVMMKVFQVNVLVALAVIIGFTFTYMFFGGASAHIWTNTIQAGIKIGVALLLLASGVEVFNGGLSALWAKLNAISPNYGSMVNPDSRLFRDYFEVVFCNFIIGIAIVTQPHIISKSLFLRSERDVNTYLATAMIAEVLFFSVLFTGIYARLLLSTPDLTPDRVISTYIMERFSPLLRGIIMLGILASGFSTMEGIILSLSSIFSNDFVRNVFGSGPTDESANKQRLLRVSRIFMIVLAPVTFLLAYNQISNPNLSVAIFAQNGVYALIAATFAPVLYGVLYRGPVPKHLVLVASSLALLIHIGMYYGNITMYHNNPAVPATCGILASTAVLGIGLRFGRPTTTTSPTEVQ
jgi:SSS family solute:Na+ symporter/sodium/pantothenate symporter